MGQQLLPKYRPKAMWNSTAETRTGGLQVVLRAFSASFKYTDSWKLAPCLTFFHFISRGIRYVTRQKYGKQKVKARRFPINVKGFHICHLLNPSVLFYAQKLNGFELVTLVYPLKMETTQKTTQFSSGFVTVWYFQCSQINIITEYVSFKCHTFKSET